MICSFKFASSAFVLTCIKAAAGCLSKSVVRNLTLTPRVGGATITGFSRPPYERYRRCWKIWCVYFEERHIAVGKLLSMKPEPFLIKLIFWWPSHGTPVLRGTLVEKQWFTILMFCAGHLCKGLPTFHCSYHSGKLHQLWLYRGMFKIYSKNLCCVTDKRRKYKSLLGLEVKKHQLLLRTNSWINIKLIKDGIRRLLVEQSTCS